MIDKTRCIFYIIRPICSALPVAAGILPLFFGLLIRAAGFPSRLVAETRSAGLRCAECLDRTKRIRYRDLRHCLDIVVVIVVFELYALDPGVVHHETEELNQQFYQDREEYSCKDLSQINIGVVLHIAEQKNKEFDNAADYDGDRP